VGVVVGEVGVRLGAAGVVREVEPEEDGAGPSQLGEREGRKDPKRLSGELFEGRSREGIFGLWLLYEMLYDRTVVAR
jgi:hypothetical protein